MFMSAEEEEKEEREGKDGKVEETSGTMKVDNEAEATLLFGGGFIVVVIVSGCRLVLVLLVVLLVRCGIDTDERLLLPTVFSVTFKGTAVLLLVRLGGLLLYLLALDGLRLRVPVVVVVVVVGKKCF